MGDEMKYEIAQNAYIKLVLHALKHKTSSVDGILVGRIIKNEVVEISEAIPLSHSHIGLLPTLEIALLLIEEQFGTQSLRVVGYYHANDRCNDPQLSNVAKKIGDHIYRYSPHVALLLLDNKQLEALPKDKDCNPAVQLYTRDLTKNWKQAGSGGSGGLSVKEPAANVVLLDCISSGEWEAVVDFDDHLDDISKDWLNRNLFN